MKLISWPAHADSKLSAAVISRQGAYRRPIKGMKPKAAGNATTLSP
jgi:hypothetical protein